MVLTARGGARDRRDTGRFEEAAAGIGSTTFAGGGITCADNYEGNRTASRSLAQSQQQSSSLLRSSARSDSSSACSIVEVRQRVPSAGSADPGGGAGGGVRGTNVSSAPSRFAGITPPIATITSGDSQRTSSFSRVPNPYALREASSPPAGVVGGEAVARRRRRQPEDDRTGGTRQHYESVAGVHSASKSKRSRPRDCLSGVLPEAGFDGEGGSAGYSDGGHEGAGGSKGSDRSDEIAPQVKKARALSFCDGDSDDDVGIVDIDTTSSASCHRPQPASTGAIAGCTSVTAVGRGGSSPRRAGSLSLCLSASSSLKDGGVHGRVTGLEKISEQVGSTAVRRSGVHGCSTSGGGISERDSEGRINGDDGVDTDYRVDTDKGAGGEFSVTKVPTTPHVGSYHLPETTRSNNTVDLSIDSPSPPLPPPPLSRTKPAKVSSRAAESEGRGKQAATSSPRIGCRGSVGGVGVRGCGTVENVGPNFGGNGVGGGSPASDFCSRPLDVFFPPQLGNCSKWPENAVIACNHHHRCHGKNPTGPLQ